MKTGNTVYFDMKSYMTGEGCIKTEDRLEKGQGVYEVPEYVPKISISSEHGICDINIYLLDGKRFYIESKKGKKEKTEQEYLLMHEMIGLRHNQPKRRHPLPNTSIYFLLPTSLIYETPVQICLLWVYLR